jgi:hypothetical protein
MTTTDDLIPRPAVVRDRLAYLLREARLLRRQLRLSITAAQDRQHQATAPAAPQPAAARPGGAAHA